MNRAALISVLGAVAVASLVWIAPPEFLTGYFAEADATPRPVKAKPQPVRVENMAAATDFAPVNPLSTIAVESMNAMVERPLFNPSRAPPPPVVEEPALEPVAEVETPVSPSAVMLPAWVTGWKIPVPGSTSTRTSTGAAIALKTE